MVGLLTAARPPCKQGGKRKPLQEAQDPLPDCTRAGVLQDWLLTVLTPQGCSWGCPRRARSPRRHSVRVRYRVSESANVRANSRTGTRRRRWPASWACGKMLMDHRPRELAPWALGPQTLSSSDRTNPREGLQPGVVGGLSGEGQGLS